MLRDTDKTSRFPSPGRGRGRGRTAPAGIAAACSPPAPPQPRARRRPRRWPPGALPAAGRRPGAPPSRAPPAPWTHRPSLRRGSATFDVFCSAMYFVCGWPKSLAVRDGSARGRGVHAPGQRVFRHRVDPVLPAVAGGQHRIKRATSPGTRPPFRPRASTSGPSWCSSRRLMAVLVGCCHDSRCDYSGGAFRVKHLALARLPV